MISGGAGGRMYLPAANAHAAISAMTIIERADANVPNLCAQFPHRWPRSRARQPLRASRSPHSTQKFAVDIAGDLCEGARIIFHRRVLEYSLTTSPTDTKVSSSFLLDCNNNFFCSSFIQKPPREPARKFINETQNPSDNRDYDSAPAHDGLE